MAAERLIYKRTDGKWAWKLTSQGHVIATDGGRGYRNEADCRRIADAVIGGAFSDAETRVLR